MNKENLKTILADQQESIVSQFKEGKILKRAGLHKCKKYLSHPNILLVSGLRRAGKSFFSHLLAEKDTYVGINFDDERLLGFATEDFNLLLECFYELHDDFNYIILDEIQNIPGWELFVNRLRNKYRVIITGSNANLLSSELATHLTGRFIAFSVFPLSFEEYLRFRLPKINNNDYSTKTRSQISSLFNKYLIEGGVFDYYKFGPEFARTLFSSIISKDIVARYQIKHPQVLEELALLLANNFAAKISVNKLTESLKLKSPHTTKQYIDYLETTFLFFSVSKFSYKLKEQLGAFKKIYVVDNGITSSLVLGFSENKGRFLENLVAIELKRKSLSEDFSFFYWDNYNHECDFVVKKGTKIIKAYQVCWELTSKNRDREINGLLQAMKEFKLKEGYILTESTSEIIKENGLTINVIPVWTWLTANTE